MKKKIINKTKLKEERRKKDKDPMSECKHENIEYRHLLIKTPNTMKMNPKTKM